MSKILELADAYARETHPALIAEARAALVAEVERMERRVFDMRVIFDAACTERDALRALITKLHTAKGRYHTQLAACDLFDAVGLKNERPTK